MTDQEAEDKLFEIDEQGLRLTPWEIKFVSGLIDGIAEKRFGFEDLTNAQRETIRKIHEQRVP